MMQTIKVSTFTRYPGPRFKRLGKGSGEEFRDEYLWPAFEMDPQIQVDLDGVRGYGSSFLEETFGGLIRKYKLKKNDVTYLRNHLISNNNPSLILEIQEYIDDEING